MPSASPAPAPAAEGITRRNYGRNHSYKIDGLKVPGVTTITGHFKSGALVEYPGKQVANYAVDNWGTLGELPPAARLKSLLGSRWADRDAAAGRGTQVHAIARRLHEGETEVPYPDELAGHVEACVDFLDRLEPKIIAAELIIGNRIGPLLRDARPDRRPRPGPVGRDDHPARPVAARPQDRPLGNLARDRATARRLRTRRGVPRRGRRRAAYVMARGRAVRRRVDPRRRVGPDTRRHGAGHVGVFPISRVAVSPGGGPERVGRRGRRAVPRPGGDPGRDLIRGGIPRYDRHPAHPRR